MVCVVPLAAWVGYDDGDKRKEEKEKKKKKEKRN